MSRSRSGEPSLGARAGKAHRDPKTRGGGRAALWPAASPTQSSGEALWLRSGRGVSRMQKARPRLSSRLSPSPEQAWAESSCSPLGPCKEKPQGAQKLGKLRPEHGKKEEKEGNLRSGEPNQMPWVKPSAQCPVLSKHPLNGDGDGGGG